MKIVSDASTSTEGEEDPIIKGRDIQIQRLVGCFQLFRFQYGGLP